MTEAKRYHVGEHGLVEGPALGRLSVYLAADYEQLRDRLHNAERMVELGNSAVRQLVEERAQLADVIKRFEEGMPRVMEDNYQIRLERDRLKAALAEARGLLVEPQRFPSSKWADKWQVQRDAWLEANK